MIVENITLLKPKKIIYVSCDLMSLKRDMQSFQERGYVVKAVQPIDMFPQTHHIETVVLLEKV